MQNLPIYLYPNTIDIILDMDANIVGVNRIMYQRDLKIQKGIKNQIQIQFKNSDQKKIRISNTQTFVFSMFDAINQRLIINKNLDILDNGSTSTKGLALLTLNESDTLDLDRTSYQYGVKVLDSEDNSYTPAYTNTYYGMAGTIHLNNDLNPVLKDSVSVTTFNGLFNPSTGNYEYYSGNLYANPEYNGNDALHTIQLYLTGYSGTIYIQSTLDNNPGPNGNYSTIATLTYTGQFGIKYQNFSGVYSYVRIKHIPTAGTLDKILYRS
jgi:hypothetical protein